jgi:hypothetical protein
MDLMARALTLAGIGLLAWAAPAVAQRPSYLESVAAIEKSRAIALDYGRSLPDFVCTEQVYRYIDMQHRGMWALMDRLTIKLSYFEQNEDHQLTLIDGKPTGRQYDELEGGVTVGEFGASLLSIFDPASEADFQWTGWKNVRKHHAASYSFVVAPAHSRYTLMFKTGGQSHQGMVGFHGVVEVDRDSGEVLRFTYIADDIPKEIGIEYAVSAVDYDSADVGGRGYLLPAHAETVMRSAKMWVRNHVDFREYRKFSTESTITFGDGK